MLPSGTRSGDAVVELKSSGCSSCARTLLRECRASISTSSTAIISVLARDEPWCARPRPPCPLTLLILHRSACRSVIHRGAPLRRAQAVCSSHAGDAAACFSPHSHRCPHSVACFLRVLASQVFMLCKCVSRAYISHGGKPAPRLLRRAQPSTTCVEKRLFALCVCSHVPYIWPSCVLISSSVCCRRHVRVWGWGQPSSSSAARTSHAHLARSAPLFASAAQHAPPPRGPILSELASR